MVANQNPPSLSAPSLRSFRSETFRFLCFSRSSDIFTCLVSNQTVRKRIRKNELVYYWDNWIEENTIKMMITTIIIILKANVRSGINIRWNSFRKSVYLEIICTFARTMHTNRRTCSRSDVNEWIWDIENTFVCIFCFASSIGSRAGEMWACVRRADMNQFRPIIIIYVLWIYPAKFN